MIKQIGYGLSCPWRATQILFGNKILWKYIFFTWLIAFFFLFLFYILYIVFACIYIAPMAEHLDENIPAKMKKELVKVLLSMGRPEDKAKEKTIEEILHIFFLLLAIVLALIVQAIVNKPINNKISKQVEKIVTGRIVQFKPPPFWKAFKQKMKERFLFFFLSLLFVPVFYIPYLRSVAILLYSSFFAGKAYCEYALDRRYLSYDLKKKKMKKHFFLISSLGLVCFIFLMIPVLNLLFISVNIISGTIASVEKIDYRSSVKKK